MYKVKVHNCITNIKKKEWDDLIKVSHSSPFYTYEYLLGIEKYPLIPIEEIIYISIFTHDDSLVAALPLFILEWSDPLGIIKEKKSEKILISHIWHCYDSCFLINPLFGYMYLKETLLGEVKQIAKGRNIKQYGFINLEESKIWDVNGEKWKKECIDSRFILDMTNFQTINMYLNSLKKRHRKNINRYKKRADEQGINYSKHTPPFTDCLLEKVNNLCESIALKHKNNSYYSSGMLKKLLRQVEDKLLILTLEWNGHIIAASVCFSHNGNLHTWIGGADYNYPFNFSPNYVLFYHEVEEAINGEFRMLEAGRRNKDFKIRYGMNEIKLYSMLNTK